MPNMHTSHQILQNYQVSGVKYTYGMKEFGKLAILFTSSLSFSLSLFFSLSLNYIYFYIYIYLYLCGEKVVHIFFKQDGISLTIYYCDT